MEPARPPLTTCRFKRLATALGHPVFLDDELSGVAGFVKSSFPSHKAVLVTQRGLAMILAPAISRLQGQLPGMPVLIAGKGERHKSRSEKQQLEDSLFAAGFGRDTLILALGGGTLTDLCGFTAGTFMRGVPWVAIPSTLLGMVDASLGGKTGVNTPCGKNMVGMFHPPVAVFESLDLLSTLPLAQWRNGLAECLKHGLIADPNYFSFISQTPLRNFREDNAAQMKLVGASVKIKGSIVAKDQLERSGARNLLNAGHTIGHALELLSGWRISHGGAVASGLCWEAACSCAQGMLPQEALSKIAGAFARHGFPPLWERFSSGEVLESATSDKKNRRGEVRYVPIASIGRPALLKAPHTATLTAKALSDGLCLLKEMRA